MTHTVEEVSKLQGNRDWWNTVTLLCGTRCDSIMSQRDIILSQRCDTLQVIHYKCISEV